MSDTNNTNYEQYNYQQPYQQSVTPDNSFDYQPISMWGYFGYQILFAIPCIGFIFLLVFSFGGTKNINLRNFARSYFCVLILGVILLILFTLFFGGLAALSLY